MHRNDRIWWHLWRGEMLKHSGESSIIDGITEVWRIGCFRTRAYSIVQVLYNFIRKASGRAGYRTSLDSNYRALSTLWHSAV